MKYKINILTVVITMLFCGCVKEQHDGSVASGDEVAVTLNLSVPGKSIPQSRGLSVQDESQVQQLDVLVFLESGSGYIFAYHTPGVLSGNSTPVVTLRNSKNGDRYLLVFLANLSDRVNAVVDDLAGLSKDDALARITFDAQNYCNQSGAVIRYLPMWGEFGPLEITPSLAGTNLGTVYMLRSVASIDVGVNMGNSQNPQGLGNKFYIKSVSLVNGQAKGQAAPYMSNYNSTGGTSGKGIVTAPSLPAPATIGSPVKSEHATPDFAFIREIYVPEALNSTTNPISVVVEGIYIEDGGLPSEGESTFYRIELIRDNDRTTACNLLRNHRYIINIENVYGHGYTSFNEALNEPPFNIVTQLLINDEQLDINYIVYNESYYLGVDQMKLEFKENANSVGELQVLTNYHQGWTAKISADPDNPDVPLSGAWLYMLNTGNQVQEMKGGYGQIETISMGNTVLPGATSRTAYLHISTTQYIKIVITLSQSK